MADPTSFQPQSTNRLPGSTNPYESLTLDWHYFSVNTQDATLSGSWYQARYTIDLSQFNFGVSPTIEAIFSDADDGGNLYFLPSAVTNSSGSLIRNFQIYTNTGAKSGGNSTKVIFNLGGTSFHGGWIYFRIKSEQATSTLYTRVTPTIT